MQKRVLYGGAFDLLHTGHIRAIKRAKKYGYLIVNVSSDKQVREKKGSSRPIIPEKERIEMVKSLSYVDEVVCFQTSVLDLDDVINKTHPDILITNTRNREYDKICRKHGVKVIKLPRMVPESKLDTTKIITKIKEV